MSQSSLISLHAPECDFPAFSAISSSLPWLLFLFSLPWLLLSFSLPSSHSLLSSPSLLSSLPYFWLLRRFWFQAVLCTFTTFGSFTTFWVFAAPISFATPVILYLYPFFNPLRFHCCLPPVTSFRKWLPTSSHFVLLFSQSLILSFDTGPCYLGQYFRNISFYTL